MEARAEPLPEQESVALMRRVAVAMFVVGGLTCLSGVWMTATTPDAKASQAAVAAVLVATGLLLGVVRPRRRLLEASVLWGILVVSVLIARSRPIGMAPVFYLWPAVYAAYFSARRFVVVAFAWMVVALAVGLAVNPVHPLKLDTFTGTVSMVGLMATLVASMTDREGRLRRQLALAAGTDPLTGLWNRRSFGPRLEAALAEAAARGRPLCVVMIDLDHFKQLNDRFGHHAGDRVLEEVAAVLQAESRDDDVAARLGGEEFAVVLPGAGVEDARRFTARVAAALATVVVADDRPVAISAGVAARTGAGESGPTLLARADAALYAAKEGGRGRAACWGDQITVWPAYGEPADA